MEDALTGGMHLVSQTTPAPRLLSTVVPELREKPPERATMRSRLKSASLFSGNGRAIFLGITLGAFLIYAAGYLWVRHQEARRHAEEERQLLAVSSHSIIPAPEPIVIRISADLIHVTAISLGHPRLAIINGKFVSEGESVTVHPPDSSVAVTLRVTRIADGNIELSDGTQVIKARLEVVAPARPKA
jgi:hypothetical protein